MTGGAGGGPLIAERARGCGLESARTLAKAPSLALARATRGTEGLQAAWVGGNGGEAGEAASPRNLPVKYEKDRGSSLRVFLLFLRWVEFEHS